MKKLLLLFAAILMASTGMWAETVDYLYPVYNTADDPTSRIKEWKTASVDATVVEDAATPVTWGTAGETTWYVVKGTDVTLSQGAICSGNVHLILADGAKLTATGIDDVLNSTPGIQVSGDGNSLTVYVQTAQTGILKATGNTYSAGIGGISTNGLRDGSNITINGGTITADGGSQAAAIGGGLRGNGSNIIINGGTVTAKGSAAGIGGGCYGNGTNITINGGTMIHAKAGNGSAGIGGGENGNGSNITINSGTVWAEGSRGGAGIGGGYAGQEYFEGGQGSSITINGGNVTAEGEDGSDGIGNGANATAPSSDIFVATWCIVKAGSSSNSTDVIENTGSDLATSLADKQYATIESLPTVSASYIYPVYNDPDDVTKGVKEWATEKVIAYEVISSDAPVTWGEAGKETWYVVTGEDVTLSKGAACVGNVNLILADGAQLTATGITDTANNTSTAGIQLPRGDGNSLAIYSQAEQSGQLEANGGVGSAGIGGGIGGYGYHITINGGIVTAHGGDFAAGIGGGYTGAGYNITINGGTVTANGGIDAAGIGGGYTGAGYHITINGGTVTATGGERGASIGGGYQGDCDNITINGGTVWAEGSRGCAGIGSGINGDPALYIFVATTLIVKADGNNPPTTVIANNGGDLAKSLAGRQYVTITEPYFNITANQDPDDETHYYSTFYSRTCDYQVPSGVTAYTGAVDGSVLKLTAITGGIIPAGEAVILRLTSEDTTEGKKKFALTATTTTATKSTNNALKGTDEEKTLGEKDYALSYGQNGVGFYLWNGKSIDAHKAYLTLASGAKAFTFEFNDEPSGIKETFEPYDGTTETYNLNGMRVGKDYKGIVVVRGKKYLKK